MHLVLMLMLILKKGSTPVSLLFYYFALFYYFIIVLVHKKGSTLECKLLRCCSDEPFGQSLHDSVDGVTDRGTYMR